MAIKGHPFDITKSKYVPMYGMAKAKDLSLVDTDEHDPSLYVTPARTIRNAIQQPVAHVYKGNNVFIFNNTDIKNSLCVQIVSVTGGSITYTFERSIDGINFTDFPTTLSGSTSTNEIIMVENKHGSLTTRLTITASANVEYYVVMTGI